MFSLHLDYPAHEEEIEIVRRTTLRVPPSLEPVATLEDIQAVQRLVLAAPVSDHVIDYAVRLAAATRPNHAAAPPVTKEFVEWGAGPRASQYLVLGAKALALFNGNVAAETAGRRAVAHSVLATSRHHELSGDRCRQKVARCCFRIAQGGAGEGILKCDLLRLCWALGKLDFVPDKLCNFASPCFVYAVNDESTRRTRRSLAFARQGPADQRFRRFLRATSCAKCGAQKQSEPGFFALLRRRWQFALASAAVASVIAGAGWQYWQADFSSGSSDQLTVIARQLSDSPEYDVISDLDELIASEETSVWLEGPIY
jgi:hypothetical protein